MLRKCLLFLRLAPAILIVLILRALRPLVLVRFGRLPGGAIGLDAGSTELYLCERDAGLHPERTLDVFYCTDRIPSHQLKKMWQRTLNVLPLVGLLSSANSMLPGGAPHTIRFPTDMDFNGVIPQSRAHLLFKAGEERLGQSGLRALGVPQDAPFVCIYARDTGYKGRDTGHRWSSELNLDESLNHGYRNASIQNFVPAAEELARRGYFVIRMGAVVNETLETANPMIIDYASTARSDFMDIYLCAHCSFFLGGNGGLNAVPRIFRRPVLSDNFVPLALDNLLTLYPGSLLIPKKLWHREMHRFMTFKEFLEIPRGNWGWARHYERIGVDVVENTPEEIYAVAMEMDDRLQGTWRAAEEDEELQQRFWSLLKIREPTEEFRPRMGAEFLRNNRELLN